MLCQLLLVELNTLIWIRKMCFYLGSDLAIKDGFIARKFIKLGEYGSCSPSNADEIFKQVNVDQLIKDGKK